MESLARGFAGCDYLQGLARAERTVRGIPEDARGAFGHALVRRLARHEHCTPALLNLVGDLKLAAAEPVLMAHALSDGFWPAGGSGAGADPGWSPDRRAALTTALAKLGCARLAPVLRRELARRPAAPSWLSRTMARAGIGAGAKPGETTPPGGMDDEEERAHRRALETVG